MRPPCKRVAVVGGGFAGVAAIKALKEDGIEPICFEKTDRVGGLWNYRDEVDDGVPSLMWSTTINHSKELGTVSDAPMPKESPNFLRHFDLNKNFLLYAKKFDLLRHVTCNREVVHVKRSPDYDETGRWSVSVKNTDTGDITTEIFDGVMVCRGMYSHPKMAKYPGMDKFRGKIMHTHSLKTVGEFSGQRITVIGTGCSAMDAAVETSSVAKQVYLSTRTPSWITPRVGPNGLPFDYALLRRYIVMFQDILPTTWASWIVEQYFLNAKFNHKLYGINPKYPLLGRDPIVNDHIPSKLISGAVVLRNDIKYFTENGVVFEDEDEVTKTDTVIMATGYDCQFPFLEENTVSRTQGRINLYKCIFPTHLKHPTLAIIGFFLPYGAMFALGEIQTRWVAHLLSHNGSLPSKQIMDQDVKERHDANAKRFSPSDLMTVRVDYIQYMDEIATQFGVKPNFWKMAFTDPRLFIACIFGPCVPFQYRLEGPHKWDGARKAILESPERMQSPLSPKKVEFVKKKSTSVSILKSFVLPIIMCSLLTYSDSLSKYYLVASIIPIYLLCSRCFMKFFFVLLILPFFFHFHGFTAITIMGLFIIIFCNLGVLIVNRHFWF